MKYRDLVREHNEEPIGVKRVGFKSKAKRAFPKQFKDSDFIRKIPKKRTYKECVEAYKTKKNGFTRASLKANAKKRFPELFKEEHFEKKQSQWKIKLKTYAICKREFKKESEANRPVIKKYASIKFPEDYKETDFLKRMESRVKVFKLYEKNKNVLNYRENFIVKNLLEGKTLKKLGGQLGLSKQGTQQIWKKSLKKMREIK